MGKSSLWSLVLVAALASCHSHVYREVRTPPRTVSMQIEVYDPVTNRVWVGVGVRVVEADQEWSGRRYANPDRNDWVYTDTYGTAYFAPSRLADAQVGFREDECSCALIYPDYDSDEASVLLEVWAPGFDPVLVRAQIDWHRPDVYVSVPF